MGTIAIMIVGNESNIKHQTVINKNINLPTSLDGARFPAVRIAKLLIDNVRYLQSFAKNMV